MYRANIYTKPINNSKISTLFWYLCNHIFHDNQLLFFLVGVDVWFPRRWNIWQILDGLRSFNVQCSKAVKVDTCVLHIAPFLFTLAIGFLVIGQPIIIFTEKKRKITRHVVLLPKRLCLNYILTNESSVCHKKLNCIVPANQRLLSN